KVESYFGTRYPFPKLDLLAIPITVTFGAMENPGLITYGQKFILTKPELQTVRFQRTFAEFTAHEVAHQWFGDLVTLAWWDDVRLNESFADWMEYRVVTEWKPEWEAAVDRITS